MHELKLFFAPYLSSTETIKLNNYETITNLGVFIKSHIEILEHNSGKRLFMPYYERLQKVKQILIDKQK